MSTVYLRAGSLEQARDWLLEHPDARLLAGGQSLLPAIRLGLSSPSHLIDLQDLAALRVLDASGLRLDIGAMVPHARVAADPEVGRRWPMIGRLAAGIADAQVRAVGTIGGSLANNDPAACWPAGVLACGARIHTDRRVIDADDFFAGLFATALEAGELIVRISFPAIERASYLKFEQPASRFALVGVAVARLAADGAVRVALTGLGQGVCRWTEAEDRLCDRFDPDAIDGLAINADDAASDLHASAQYRAHLAGVLLRRAVAAAGAQSVSNFNAGES